MLLKAEFDENMSNLERSADDMLSGGEGKSCLVFTLMSLVYQYAGTLRYFNNYDFFAFRNDV